MRKRQSPRGCTSRMTAQATMPPASVSCLEEYKDCDVNEITEKYIEGQPKVSAVPVLPDEGGTIIDGMDTEDKSVREGTGYYDIRFRAIVPGTGGADRAYHQCRGAERFLPKLSHHHARHVLLLPNKL